ncbi:PQQ-dependent sugar dehydrogenase [Brevibacterium sp. UCMA 11754]|uniref:PQQ-dependent sugar dehydrogenase n=1 Tax=Brevibacterium sp. UCMA 11754 TaxID=2749198 RepID=UPI001F46DBCB|nr:PQQ-dependent sugar dehydrogenase [Brevibacterium sp. UCMA 11754]MCF2574483.1 PQQ-dependent sugar dehydrogenase [Brevibacterium sp. UCMA 11754]
MPIRRHDRSLLHKEPPCTGPHHLAAQIGDRAAGSAQKRAAVAMTLMLALSGCGSDQGDTPHADSPSGSSAAPASQNGNGADEDSRPDVESEVVAQNLEAPWSIAFYEETALVSERDSARILEIDSQRPADIREVATVAGVSASGEGGLLGLSVRGDSLYAYFTAESDNRIQRFPITRGSDGLELGSPKTIVDGIAKAGFHNGGRLAFGPDGMLYATVGDAGDQSAAQDRESLSGSILRMKPDGSVPEDNPFDDSLVYSYGHRNAQGLAWDEDGTMYASEFGQDAWDELNIIEAGGNYGWPEVEGISEGGAEDNDFIDPVQQWSPDQASPSGIAISHDTILIANLRGQVLRTVPSADVAKADVSYSGDFGRLRDVVTTPSGEVWILTNNTDGRGDPADGDDRILRIPSDLSTGSR